MNTLAYDIKEKIREFRNEQPSESGNPETWDNYSLQRYKAGWNDAIEDSNTILQEFCVLILNVDANSEVIKKWYEAVVIDRIALEALVAQIHAFNAENEQERNTITGRVNGFLYLMMKLEEMEKRI